MQWTQKNIGMIIVCSISLFAQGGTKDLLIGLVPKGKHPAVAQIMLGSNDLYRFSEIKIDESLSECDEGGIQELLNDRHHGDDRYPERRILIAKALRFHRAECNPTRFLEQAVLQGDYWLVKYLLEHGADANGKSICGDPLIIAVKSIPIARILILHGADLSKVGFLGTVLHYCYSDDYPADLVVYYITEDRDSVKALGSHKRTPLHSLLFFGSGPLSNVADVTQKAKILVAAGADLRARDEDGFTLLELCKREEQFCTPELLALLNPDKVEKSEEPETEKASEEEGEKCCPICLDPFLESPCFLACAHAFHSACVMPWIERHATCPLCRTDV